MLYTCFQTTRMDETEDSLVFIFRFNHFDKEILQALSFYSKVGTSYYELEFRYNDLLHVSRYILRLIIFDV